MADTTEEEDELEFQQADAGLLFRAEMWATNAFLGYWQYLVAGLAVILLGFLLWGQYTSWVVSDQRSASQRIHETTGDLPQVDVIGRSMAFGAGPAEPEELAETAGKLEEVAAGSRGAARVEAYLKAAELYRLAKDETAMRRVLEAAEGDAEGVMAYGVQVALANLDLEAGNGDQAVERLRSLTEEGSVLAEQASIDLGRALETLNRDEEARKVYDEFETKWPESSRLEEVRERKKAVAG